jgi:hypothetical protein
VEVAGAGEEDRQSLSVVCRGGEPATKNARTCKTFHCTPYQDHAEKQTSSCFGSVESQPGGRGSVGLGIWAGHGQGSSLSDRVPRHSERVEIQRKAMGHSQVWYTDAGKQ